MSNYGQPGFPAGYYDYRPEDARSAVTSMPAMQDLGGHQPGVPPWIRVPFYPTAPFTSTNPTVGQQVRFYSGALITGDADYVVNTEAIRGVQFDIPCRLIAINGSARDTNTPANLTGLDPRDEFLFRLEYTNGDRLHITQRLGSTVVGRMGFPGELGGVGWTIDRGASVILGITPLRANLRIDITLVCLEIRGPSNYVSPGR